MERTYDPAMSAAAHTASAEADQARTYGAGEEGFAMNNLPGDKQTMDQGIKKMTRIDVDSERASEAERSDDPGALEGGGGHRTFI